MIYVYPPDCTDFTTNGAGPIDPQSAIVTETLNGEWELKIEHPLDETGKWQRLIEGCILRAPVPAAMTPRAELVVQEEVSSSTDIYRVHTNTGERLHLRSGPSLNASIIGKYNQGSEVILLKRTNSTWYEVSCPDGKHGYMWAEYLTFVRTDSTYEEAVSEVIEPRQLRDQPFRIYRIVPDLEKITVYARHIFYDLLDNMLRSVKPSKTDRGAAVVQMIAEGCMSEHDFTFYSNLTKKCPDAVFENKNPVEAILGSEGLVEKYGGELARDWFDVFIVKRVGKNTNIQIRQGKNLTGISYDVDTTNVTTRIMPTGQDKNGKILYLPEVYIDSENIDAYPRPKWMHLDVPDAKEVTKGDDQKTKAQCYTEMREAAQAEFDKGCDLPVVTLKVDFVNCADTEEYRQYGFLQNIYLGDTVRVIASRIGVAVSMRMTQYSYNCLTKRYESMTLGTVADTPEGNIISAWQLPTGIISGSRLAIGSVGTGQLQAGSVGSLQVQLAAIQTAHIEDAAITSAQIQEATIQSAHIAEAAIQSAHIDDAVIQSAHIAEAAIQSAHIAEAAIQSAHIDDAVIQSAHIAEAAIQSAHIDDAVIQSAHIAEAAIQSAHIDDAAIQSAHIADAAITRAHIALLAVSEAQINDLAVSTAKIQNAAIDTAQIRDLAVTGAKIANATITNANIANATIGTAQIELGAITTALIQAGAVGTAQIADASITDAKIVELSANRITTGTLAVERLVIVGSTRSIVYTINEANGTAQLSQTTIDGGALTQRTITADRIVAGAITANEIAAATILANNIAAGAITAAKLAANSVETAKIKAGAVTTSKLAANVGEELDLSSNNSIALTVKPLADDIDALQEQAETTMGSIRAMAVGGVNLVDNSEVITITGTDTPSTSCHKLAEITPGKVYTLSMASAIKKAGTASGMTLAIYSRKNGTTTLPLTKTLSFSGGHQQYTFTAPEGDSSYVNLFAGIRGSSNGVVVEVTKVKLEEGTFATTWTQSQDDLERRLSSLSTSLQILRDGMRLVSTHVYGSYTDEDGTTTTESDNVNSQLQQIDDFFHFDDSTPGNPKLIIGTSLSDMQMELSNSKLSFKMSGDEVAYFSDNKLYVTNVEAIERMSIGTPSNGYLEMVTTDTGVGFLWRS